jgi:transmembrane sensor
VYIVIECDKTAFRITIMPDKNQQFRHLMINHLSGHASENEERALFDLLNSDPQYKIIYAEMAKIRAISYIPILENEKKSSYKTFIKSLHSGLSSNVNFTPFRKFLRIAAVVLFMFSTSVSSYYFFTQSNTPLVTCETFVPFGSQVKIILPDKSVAWLNSGSTLKYNNQFGKKKREVQLTGEGYFEVTKDKSKPFLVNTNNIEIKVLGTVFNVHSYLNDSTVEVNLLEGKVDVSFLNSDNSKTLTLMPNEKMIYNKKAGTLYSCKADAAKSAQWTVGKLCFIDASLEKITKELERKFDVQIKLETPNINNEVFSGSLNLNQPLNELLDYLDVDKKFTKIYRGKTVLIKNKK